MNTENQQIASLKSEDVEISNTKIGAEGYVNSNHKKTEKLEEEEDQIVVEDDYEDEEVTVLAFWYGDQQLDVLTAEEWIESIQRAKVQSEWNDLVTMHKVSISSSFYLQIFRKNIVSAAFYMYM
jgi:hypothetical protein